MKRQREWGRWAADVVAVGLAVVAAVVAFQAKSGEVSRAHDAVQPCAQAKHPDANVLCIIGGELDRRAAARDVKEAKVAAAAAAKAKALAVKFNADVCGLLHDLPSTAHTDAVRRDLHCLTSTPALVPGPTATAQTSPSAPVVPSPSRSTPAGTGTPTPKATPSGAPGASPSPPASPPHPSPTGLPPLVCAPPLIRIGGCP